MRLFKQNEMTIALQIFNKKNKLANYRKKRLSEVDDTHWAYQHNI